MHPIQLPASVRFKHGHTTQTVCLKHEEALACAPTNAKAPAMAPVPRAKTAAGATRVLCLDLCLFQLVRQLSGVICLGATFGLGASRVLCDWLGLRELHVGVPVFFKDRLEVF